ncbi:MAG TPA: glycosyltransferase [Tepidisphaeraceae bacterium]|nr:glycosyltransferase [Tepidisphaeraceae bacterium]
MDGSAPRISWTPLKNLGSRFSANVQALAGRYPELADALRAFVSTQTYYVHATAQTVQLGVGDATGVTPLPHSLAAPAAADVIHRLYPSAVCNKPIVIVGEDMGWLWNGIYQLPCKTPEAPGHRSPLYFLIREIERLWIILHVQNWQNLLADARVLLFVGNDAMNDFRQSLGVDHACPWPRLSVRVDPMLWSESPTLDEILAEAGTKACQEFLNFTKRFRPASAATPAMIASRLESGQPLKILGLTSRFTTFLQYSMRDWLASFQRLGHQTRMIMEQHDHQACNDLTVAAACADFQPDLVVIIDHHRQELRGVPEHVPFVMWVQDRLASIYSPEAGRSQQRLDYAIGYGRAELVQRCGYPGSRFMPAMVGGNPDRFSAAPLSEQELAPLRCDVSFVSHASMPADQIIREQIQRGGSPETRRLLEDLYERLRAIYDAGGSVTAGEALQEIIVHSLRDNRLTADVNKLLDLFTCRVNNAMFRHQAIRWVADMGLDLRLYGKGWENHPQFKRYARGAADNEAQLRAIYQASAINLQVTPFGAVHQRLIDGLMAGGFFLIRSVTADELEILLRDMWNWCQQHGIRSGREMLEKRDEKLSGLMRRYAELGAVDPASDSDLYFVAMEECAMTGFTRTINTLFDRHERVTFSVREQLTRQVKHFLASGDERYEIVREMRQRVLETHTYTAISRRMLAFIAADLARVADTSSIAA